MPSSVHKVVIPVAGLGTRFLPATKAMPKEMLPIIDKPVIQYVVEEAVASGITDVILVTSGTKRAVEDHFGDNETLERRLKADGKLDLLKVIKSVGSMANFIYLRQKGPYGNAIPVLNAEGLIGNEPFAVMFGDELVQGNIPRLAQLIKAYDRYGDPIMGVIKTDAEGTRRYGIIDPQATVGDRTHQVKGLVEKPGPKLATSRLGSIGAYILTPDIFDAIRSLKPKRGEEYVLIDAIKILMKKRPIYAHEFEGTYHDTGSKIGWLRANIAIALERPDMKTETKAMLKEMLKLPR